MHFLKSFCVASFLLLALVVNAEETPRSLYEQGRFDDALGALVDHPTKDAVWHYQLGLVYLKKNDLASALGHFEHSSKLNPLDFKTLEAVRNTYSALTSAIGRDALQESSTFYERAIETATFQVALRIVVGIWILSIVYFLFSAARKKDTGFYRMVGVSLFLLVFSIFHWVMSPAPPGYVLKNVFLQSGPGEEFLEIVSIPVGAKVRILDQNGKWLMVRFTRGAIGWVPASSLLFF